MFYLIQFTRFINIANEVDVRNFVAGKLDKVVSCRWAIPTISPHINHLT